MKGPMYLELYLPYVTVLRLGKEKLQIEDVLLRRQAVIFL